MADLTYRTDGMFARFLPSSEAGMVAWREMNATGDDVVLLVHLKSVIRQLRSAGYNVRRAVDIPTDDDALFAELLA